ncbi:MAG: hypothetical protein GY884_31915 [Proteobacteria bacterium]|nr:hypothetical protein [Pseudomonadota bacterium]
MRVVCDNCGATYKIPEHKLVREVNKATCRRCGHGIIIRKPGEGGAVAQSIAPAADGESTQITSQEELEARARAQAEAHATGGFGTPVTEDEIPATVINQPAGDETVPRQSPAPNPTLAPGPSPITPPPAPPRPTPRATTKAPPAPAAPTAGPAGVPIAKPAGHDPSGDLSLVMMGTLGAIAGACLMAATADHTLKVIGLAIALASSVTSLLVLVTGDRGRKEASIVISMFVGLFLAGGAAAAVKFTGIGAATEPVAVVAEAPTEKVKLGGTDAPEGAFNDAVADDGTPTPEEEKDALAAALAEMEKAEEEEAVADAEPEEEEAPSATPTEAPAASLSRSSSTRSSQSGSSGSSGSSSSGSSKSSSSGSSSSGSSKSSSSGSSSSSSSSSGNVGVPVTVLDTMLKSNKGVKRCFGLYRQETGSLPSGRITVKLSVQPTGRPTSARIDGGQYAGTSLDTCLGGAITKITFPPWDGSESATYYYPFIL